MADPALHGSGHTCPACELRREAVNAEIGGAVDVPCNECGGTGRIAIAETDIIAGCVAWARENYWPARIARWAQHNAQSAKSASN